MAEKFVEALYEAVTDSLKVIPVLFLAYLLVSFLSHDHSHKFSKFLSKNKKTSVLYASFLGCVPQCGFSSVLSDLYSKKTVSIGTLVAVFVATSDEAIPIMLANPSSSLDLLKLVAIKICLAIFWGYIFDLIFGFVRRKRKVQATKMVLQNKQFRQNQVKIHKSKEKTIDCGVSGDNNSYMLTSNKCGHIHSESCGVDCGHEHGHCCANNIFLDAFMHTFNIIIYIFVATFVINLIMAYVDPSSLQLLFTSNEYLQIIIASLIGLIPNCASSVILVELFILSGTISFPALIAGLTAGAGVGMIILFGKNKKHPLQNLGILAMQYAIGVISGMFLTLIF